MNRFCVVLCFIAMFCFQGYTTNHQMNRLLMVCSLLLLVRFNYKLIIDLHHGLWFIFMAWVGIGIFYSDHPMLAFQGFYPYRCEGYLTFLVMTLLAVIYWKTFESIKPLCYTVGIICLALTVSQYMNITIYNYDRIFLPSVARSSTAAESGPLLMLIHPFLAILSVFPILASGNRSALVALFVGCIFYLWFRFKHHLTKEERKFIPPLLPVMVGIIFLCLLPLAHEKLTKIPNLLHLGTGARSSWILQGSNLSHALPITGFGLDTLGEYLKPPQGAGYEDLSRFICDRTHFIPYDIILMTGWIGYTIVLLAFGYALAITLKWPEAENLACFGVVLTWAVFNCANPSGLLSNSIALTALFGIKKGDYDY